VDWYDFATRSTPQLYSFPILQQMLQMVGSSRDSLSGTVVTAEWFGEGANATHPEARTIDFFAYDPAYVVGTALENQLQFVSQCFRRQENLFVDHVCVPAPLMRGKKYLVSESERERTEAAAKDHTVHLEFLSLSREHSDSNLFSTAVQELKRIARRWLKNLNLPGTWSSFWPRFILSAQFCLSSSIISGLAN
jgi:hypothetical protein